MACAKTRPSTAAAATSHSRVATSGASAVPRTGTRWSQSGGFMPDVCRIGASGRSQHVPRGGNHSCHTLGWSQIFADSDLDEIARQPGGRCGSSRSDGLCLVGCCVVANAHAKVEEFRDDDAAYLNWLCTHRDGFVI